MWRFLSVILLAAWVASVSSAQVTGVVWRSYKSGATSVTQTADERVIQTQGAFDTYWKELTGDANSPRDVDFSKELLVAVRLGRKSSGGYRALIRGIERTLPNTLEVRYDERKPAPGALNIAMITCPWEIVRVERKTAVGAFVFKKRDVVDDSIGAGGGGPITLNWRTYMCDTTAGGSSEFTRVIRSPREWDTYWRTIFRTGAAPSDIDWNTEMLLVIHLGNRPTDGYDVLVDGIEPIRNGFGIIYLERAPSEGQRVRKTPTSPYTIIRVPRLEGDIQFRKRTWRSDG